MTTVLRALALIMVFAAIVDPALHVRRAVPVAVDIRAVDSGASAEADRVRERLNADLRDAIDTSGRSIPAAVVLVGNRIADARWPDGVPVSTVSRADAGPSTLRIVRVVPPGVAALRQSVPIDAELEATGLSGRTSTVVLESSGVTLAKAEHRWTADRERFTARLRYAAPAAGIHRVTVRALPIPGERGDDNSADADVLVQDRPLRVLIYESRPSWAATFIRRALEADGRFHVASLAHTSRAFTTRRGTAPAALTVDREKLSDFDVVVTGSPEALRANDLDALMEFARLRGGSVVLIPDRKPAVARSPGAYASHASLLDGEFDEILLENPTQVVNEVAPSLRASEFIVAKQPAAAAATMATIGHQGQQVGIAWIRPIGAGRLLFWGAADAWRFRADEGEPFTRFWQSVIADLALQAPPAVSAAVSPRRVRPAEPFAIHAAVRDTEFRRSNAGVAIPPVSARVVSTTGMAQHIRLWPTAEAGAFVGRGSVPAAGTYDVHVTAGDRSADAVLQVSDGADLHVEDDLEGLRFLAQATGGVATTYSNLEPLTTHLRGLARDRQPRTVHPMRSSWWGLALASCLCMEWTLRRRRGER